MHRLILILGSGLGVNYGLPDTKQLTSSVNVGGTYLKSKVDYYRAGTEPKENVESWPVTEMLWEALRASYEEPNFETYVHALETLEPLAASRRIPKYFGTLDEYRSVAMAYSEVLGRYEPFMRAEVLQTERLNVMVRILERLNIQPAQISAKHDRGELDAALQRLTAGYNSNILTLNYDDLIDDAFSEYFDGFTLAWDGKTALRFDRAAFLENELPDRSMLHLHGGARLGYLRDDAQLFPEIVKYQTKADALKSVRDAIAEPQSIRGEAVHGGRVYSTAPIISGIQKADKLMLAPTPFGYYYHAAIRQMLDAKRVLIVGYGCRDPHINTWVRESAEIHGAGYRVAFVTKVPPQHRWRYTNSDRLAVSIFLAPIEGDAYESWFNPGADIVTFGNRLLVDRSGVPFSNESVDAILDFLS